eukprot:TRINITY_DN1925_c0_g1_i8.p1 TRINITY_DN1925_c0_g1~~TRINITY_DN1925_c0_g1_i8.p1  ORF type:complete len:316 (-),score=67.89 TRINITY_DN1925_c0_g1_i8:107-1054(-)
MCIRDSCYSTKSMHLKISQGCTLRYTLALVCVLSVLGAGGAIDRNLQATVDNWDQRNNGRDWPGVCVTGTNQSPINIVSIKGTCDNTMVFTLTFNNTPFPTDFQYSKMHINFVAPGFANLYATNINGQLYGYTAEQAIFHQPAEHEVEGTQYDAEMQIFFKLNTNFVAGTYDMAVVSVFLQKDDSATNDFMEDLLGDRNAGKRLLDFTKLDKLLTRPIVYYSYQGSMSEPPCSERVNWYVIESPMKVTSAQLNIFVNFYKDPIKFGGDGGNSRDIQDLNDRTVKKGGVECEEQFVYFFSFFLLYVFINYFIFKLL